MMGMDITLYSHNLDQERYDLVMRIVARHGEAFSTAPHRPDDQPGGDCLWLEAHKGPNDLWSVQKVTTKDSGLYALEDGAELPERVETILPNICFFDALHYCAAFEISQPDQGMIVAENMVPPLMHYRDFAAQEHIPFDLDSGLPAPVAGGKILSDGTFLSSQRTAARQVRDNLSSERPRIASRMTAPQEKMPAQVKGDQKRALVRVTESVVCRTFVKKNEERIDGPALQMRRSLKNDFVVASKGVKQTAAFLSGAAASGGGSVGLYMTYAGLSRWSVWEFPTLFGGTMLAIAGVSLLAGATAIALEHKNKDTLTMPRRAFNREMKKYRAHIRELPESDYKEQMKLAGDEMELLYYKEATIRSFNKAASGKFWAQRRLKKDLSYLDKIMDAQELLSSHRNSILEEVRAGKASDHFEIMEEMNKRQAPLKKMLSGMGEQQITAVLAPPKHHKNMLPPPGI